ADASAPLIARQTILNPWQVPISFRLEYNRDDIDARNTYAVSATIIESDGRLAFTNDTAYDVITRGNPSRVGMLLVLVQPPPDLIEEGVDWRQWVEVPAKVIRANLLSGEQEHFLSIEFYQSTIEGCARPGSQSLKVEGSRIIAMLTLMQPPPTAWAIACDEQMVELDAVEPIDEPLEPGVTYHVIVNDMLTSSFSLPRPDLGHTMIAESPIERAEVMILESAPPQYQVLVVSGHPRGSSCSQSNGYEISRRDSTEIDVVVTHHEVADPLTVCTADFPIVETIVSLGSDFEPGREYIVRVNSDTVVTFEAQ
ncbi:MAG: YbaY family lipoprotein, partial [Dehalococcoidia bacterium]|nr:YbaY family lipoprotein [Dehalococcoidia bacterium]